jgi:hypothetical protein
MVFARFPFAADLIRGPFAALQNEGTGNFGWKRSPLA